jgi:hypothetical protein
MAPIETISPITCPHCQHESVATIPTDSCQFFYQCPECKSRLRPKPGDCCVFCSYGSIPCPSIQHDTRRSQTNQV